MALRWVHENIAPFNGDPASITLFGPCAGAASAGLLAVAPQTRDIVSRIITQVCKFLIVMEQIMKVSPTSID